MILLIIALIIIFIAFYRHSKKRTELEKMILACDQTNDYDRMESYLEANGISYEQYQQVRKEVYEQRAENGDPHALYMAACYAQGNNKPAFIRYLTKAAERGHIESMYRLGLKYSRVANDTSSSDEFGYVPSLSFYWFKMAADSGHEEAAVHVAQAYEEGEGVEKNEDYALRYLKFESERGNDACTIYLAQHYYMGIQQNYPEAVRVLERIMQRGERKRYADAAHLLGQIFSDQYERMEKPQPHLINNRYFNCRKAAYCFALAYIADQDDMYDEAQIYSVYHPTQHELETWRNDAIALCYHPM